MTGAQPRAAGGGRWSLDRVLIGALVTSAEPHSGIDIDDLALRLELGIPQEIVWLARETKRALERSDYLALHKAKLTTLDALVSSDEQALMRIVSPAVIKGEDKGSPGEDRGTAEACLGRPSYADASTLSVRIWVSELWTLMQLAVPVREGMRLLLKPKFTPTLMVACDRFFAQLVLNNILERDVLRSPQ